MTGTTANGMHSCFVAMPVLVAVNLNSFDFSNTNAVVFSKQYVVTEWSTAMIRYVFEWSHTLMLGWRCELMESSWIVSELIYVSY